MPRNKANTIYSNDFFRGQVDGSASSASVVVPLVLSLLTVKSVIDVGCGVAPWAAEFLAKDVPEVWGIDGDYVDRLQLRIPVDCFFAHDLTRPIRLNRTFDLAVCLEVAEHLPESRAHGLVADLTSLAPCVLFSSAVPGQGGTSHVNEQYLSYWADIFQEQGYEGIDPIRPWILGNKAVEWFYQQNIVMFVAKEHPLLAKNCLKARDIIHQTLYESVRTGRTLTLGKLLRHFPDVLRRSADHHLGLIR
jgi:SAM-dependent methyltransferase